jgi:polysaccharide biosynthesis protein PslF
MRVALVSAEYPPTPGGVGDYTRRLGAALAERIDAVEVWTIRDGALVSVDPRDPQGAGAPIAPASWGWGCWRAIRAGAARSRPALLHVQYQTGAYQMHPAIALLARSLRGVRGAPPVVVTAHDLLMPYLFPKAGPLRAWVTRRALEDGAALVVTNQEDYRALADGAGARGGALPRFVGRIARAPEVIPIGSNIAPAPPPGYDRRAWRARLGAGPDTTLVAFFGLISPTKGLDLLLRAIEQLPPSYRLVVVGGESPAAQDQAFADQVRAVLRGPQLAGRVVVTGHASEADVSGHLLAADLAALPFTDGASFRRGSLLAALAHALPVVTTAGVEPGLRHGEHALLIPPGDLPALCGALADLGADPALRARLAAGGAQVAAQFGWDSIADRHLDLYRRVVGAQIAA